MIEKVVKQVIEGLMPSAAGKIGGDLSYDAASQDFYIWLGLVPGGANTELEGTWIVDIDVFDTSYSAAFERALALEPLLVARGGHRTDRLRIDNVYQNEGISERPWNDDSVFRVGATYVFTARRSG
jgi:hypothetical protein